MKFSAKNLFPEKLQKIKFKVGTEWNKPSIKEVYFKNLKVNVDGRGDLTELWSEPWSKDEPVAREVKHVYFNTTHQGVTKGWHVSEDTYSQYTCIMGKMQVVLVDVRDGSSTFGFVDKFMIGSKNPSFIIIPPGVLKAWKSLQGDSIIVNLLTSANKEDNFRYPWDSILTEIWEPKNG